MGGGANSAPIRLFVSFCGKNLVASRWVSLAKAMLGNQFDVHDYRDAPEPDPDLPTALRDRIALSDVFICTLSEEYRNNDITWGEFQDAIEISTGNKNGSLRTGQWQRPLVYVVTCDEWAVNWIQMQHPKFTYHPLKHYDLQFVPPNSVVPADSYRWQDWVENMRTRLGKLAAAEPVKGLDADTVQWAGSPFIGILGRPNGQFSDAVTTAKAALVTSLGNTAPMRHVADGWHDRQDPAVIPVIRTVATAHSRSLIIQPCDPRLWSDNRTEGDPPGADLRAKLQQVGTARAEAEIARTRTMFWMPGAGDDQTGRQWRPAGEIALTDTGPWFRDDDPTALLLWVRGMLNSETLVLKAEDGISDISPKVYKGMRDLLDPLIFELVSAPAIPRAVCRAFSERTPILIAIHDRSVGDLQTDARREIYRRAGLFDQEIRRQMSGADWPRVARVIFLVRHPDKFEDTISITPDQNWMLLPLYSDDDYTPPPDRVVRLREALRS
jgi:hypothetical protein